MRNITVSDIVKATGGRLLLGDGSQEIEHISLDSRTMRGSDLFVPIIGERVDAHRFLCQAMQAGAAAVFTSRHKSRQEAEAAIEEQAGKSGEVAETARKAAWIQVEDTKAALQAFGSFLRSRITIPLVGVTGSVGKTTTREMVAAALSAGFTVYKTPGNSNSQVGVPITLSEIPEEAGIGVIELGMSEPGEMTRIAGIARVDCAVMTNIGVSHIEQLGSQENILKEKLHIQDGMREDGCLFLNGDDPLLSKVTPEGGRRACFYGMGENCDFRGKNLYLENGYPVFTAVHGGESAQVRLKVMGSHMVSNALAALAVAANYGIPMEKAAKALGSFEGYKGRQQIFEHKGIRVIDDSYNASPVSMKAGLEVLRAAGEGRRKVAVLGDMKELGPEAPRFHREIGAYIASHPIACVVLLGELSCEIGKGIKEKAAGCGITYCGSLDEVKEWLDENIKEGDCILFKGSNSMGLSKAVAYLKEK